MLFLLSAPPQTGKTRWLEQLIKDLRKSGKECIGVIAPGIWSEHPDGTFEKRGIQNVLLPTRKQIHFAYRRDLVTASEIPLQDTQSRDAHLGWAIDDAAIEDVNAHFRALGESNLTSENEKSQILIVDELGALELVHHKGLSNALGLLDRGPHGRIAHAIAVVRPDLVPRAYERLRGAWQAIQCIAPDDEGRRAIWECVSDISSSSTPRQSS